MAEAGAWQQRTPGMAPPPGTHSMMCPGHLYPQPTPTTCSSPLPVSHCPRSCCQNDWLLAPQACHGAPAVIKRRSRRPPSGWQSVAAGACRSPCPAPHSHPFDAPRCHQPRRGGIAGDAVHDATAHPLPLRAAAGGWRCHAAPKCCGATPMTLEGVWLGDRPVMCVPSAGPRAPPTPASWP